MKRKRILEELGKLPRATLLGGSFMFRYQSRMIVAAERIKNRLRNAGVSDKRISAIVAEASKKAVTSFRPFLDWLDVLATEEVSQCKANSE